MSGKCISCRDPDAELQCGLCTEPVCESCVEKSDPERFSYLDRKERPLPAELGHSLYCSGCYGNVIEPAIESYAQVMAQAKEVMVFTATQSKRLPKLKKSNKLLRIEDHTDRDDLVLRLAFQAVELGFNSIVDVEVQATKKRDEGYQKMSWSGQAYPAEIDPGKAGRYA